MQMLAEVVPSRNEKGEVVWISAGDKKFSIKDCYLQIIQEA